MRALESWALHTTCSPLSSHPRDLSIHLPHAIPMSHLDVDIQSSMDSAGGQPDGYGGGVREGSCHHMARCWKGEYLEAKFLIEVDELRRGRLLPLTQDAADCTAALLRRHLWRWDTESAPHRGWRPPDLRSSASGLIQAWMNHPL